MKRDTRRISILRRPNTGGPLAGKFMAIKVDGKLDKEALQDGWRHVYTNYGKKCTIVLYGQSPYAMEEHYEVPAGKQDVNLEVCWTGNKYVIKEALSRKLTIHRDSACPKFYLRVNVGSVPLHLLGRSLGAGDSVSFLIDTLEHDLELTPHGFTDGTLKKVTVPAGDTDIDVFVTVTATKQVIIKEAAANGKSADNNAGKAKPEKNFLPGGLSDKEIREELRKLLNPNDGLLLAKLRQCSGKPRYLRVDVRGDGVYFSLYEGCSSKNAAILYYDYKNSRINLGHYEDRNAVLQFIRTYVNHSTVGHVLKMEGHDIFLKEDFLCEIPKAPVKTKPDPVIPEFEPTASQPTPANPETAPAPENVKQEETLPEKPEHPDMYQSMTSHGIWRALYESFGPGSAFETMVKRVPATCFVTAEEEALRVTVMFEEEEHAEMVGNGGATVFEYNYVQCTQKQFMAMLEEGKTVTAADMVHNFTKLQYEEDKSELVDYLMYFIDAIPHVIVEGNSFRSRRPGEEIIEIEQTLTAKVMSHKMVQLFELDGEIMDILRRNNIAYCLIGSYNEYLKIIFVDTDDETIHTIRYDFSDLVDADFLEGEGCFSRLTCNYEKDSLDEYLGRAVCALPYFRPCMTSGGEMYSQINLNKDIVPGLDEDFVPPAEEETEVPEIPEIQEDMGIPEEPEISTEPVIIDDADFEDFDTPDTVPEEPEEPEGPVYTVQSSPTTWAIVAHLNMQFAVGGGLSQFMKAMGFDQVSLKAAAAELILEFQKSGVSCSTMQLPYKQFNKGIEGEFETLGDEDDTDKLLTILKNSAPYFK